MPPSPKTGSAMKAATSPEVSNRMTSSRHFAQWRATCSGSLGQSERYGYGDGAKEIPGAYGPPRFLRP